MNLSKSKSASNVLEIAEFKVSADEFAKLPSAERQAALFYGHIANDVSVVRRLLLLALPSSSNHLGQSNIHQEYCNTQALCLLRILAGKTMEGWDAINKGVAGIRPKKDLRVDIESHEPSALSECGSYFGKSNAIRKIRNWFAFHMDPKRWEDDDTVNYTSVMGFQCYVKDGANSLYGTSESLLFIQVVRSLGHSVAIRSASTSPNNEIARFRGEISLLFKEVLRYSDLVVRISDAIVLSILERAERMGAKFTCQRHKIIDAAIIEETQLPVFVISKPSCGNDDE